MRTHVFIFAYILHAFLFMSVADAQAVSPSEYNSGSKDQLHYKTDFESGMGDWQPIDNGWKLRTRDDSQVLSLFKKKSNFQPTVRSPLHMALLKDKTVASFQLDVRVLSTHQDYPHRDVCLFFGYQSPTEFYYVHLGKKGDANCNQILIVNNADRKKISLTTTEGTDWDDHWHDVRVVHDVMTGDIQVFFDDMETPAMTAVDNTFVWGQVGIGSFDDTADWDDIELKGIIHESKNEESQKKP